jgi:hypothetical protein
MWAGGLGTIVIGALVLCFVDGITSAFASSTTLLPIIVPIAVPLIASGNVSAVAVAVIAALAVSSTSPFSTNGALMVANRADTISEEKYCVHRSLRAVPLRRQPCADRRRQRGVVAPVLRRVRPRSGHPRLDRAMRVCGSPQAGMVGLNLGVISNPAAPFGGMKASGFGREGGFEGIHEYVETQYVGIAAT